MRQPPLPPSMNDGSGIQEFMNSSSNGFDPANEDFLDQILSSVPNSSPWVDIDPTVVIGGGGAGGGSFEDKIRRHQQQQQQVSYGSKGLMLQQQLLLSRGVNEGSSMSILNTDLNDNDSSSFNSANMGNDASMKALLNGFTGSIGQAQQFHHAQQAHTLGTAVSGGSTGGGGAGQPKQQRVRARRGQATDPHSIAERLRRERIAERMKSLQELVPNANKTDKASMLDEIIDYVKFLQLQVKVLSMSRLGGANAAAVAPLNADKSSSESRNGNGAHTASSSNDGMTTTVTEQQVAKLMEEDMGSAMQYLQGKGLCLMPISLATAISTATCQSSRIKNKSNTNMEAAGGPTSPGVSASTVQSAVALGGDASAKAE